MSDYSIGAQLVFRALLNDHLMRERDLLIDANRKQTLRNWRLLAEVRSLEGARRMLEMVAAEAEVAECPNTSEKIGTRTRFYQYCITEELWALIEATLADMAAMEADGAVMGMDQEAGQ